MLLIFASSIVCSYSYSTRREKRSLRQRLTRWFVRPIVRRWDHWYYRPPTAQQFYSRKTRKRFDFIASTSVNNESLLSDKLDNVAEFEEEAKERIARASYHGQGQSTLVGKFIFEIHFCTFIRCFSLQQLIVLNWLNSWNTLLFHFVKGVGDKKSTNS